MNKLLAHLRQLAVPVLGLVLVLVAALGLYCAVWGWARFKLDFWPLDSSRVGPNLCASLFLVVLLIAHNEFIVAERAEQQHEDHKTATREALRELLHPTEELELDVAEDLEAKFRHDVLDRLDETTPGGVGTLAQRLAEIAPPKET